MWLICVAVAKSASILNFPLAYGETMTMMTPYGVIGRLQIKLSIVARESSIITTGSGCSTNACSECSDIRMALFS